MIRTTTEKVCVLCGEDCSRKPRVKDDRGRYYCRICHQAALARRESTDHESRDAAVRSTSPPSKSAGHDEARESPPARKAFIDDDDDIRLMPEEDD